MGNIRSYLQLSEKALKIDEVYLSPDSFLSTYFELEPLEKKSFLSHFIINNNPYIFKSVPILYQQIIQYLAQELELENADIKLIGSAKTGFSISPNPDYGKPFSGKSDLDFTIFNEALFNKLKIEFNLWANQYENQNLVPKESEKKYWNDNLTIVRKNLDRGFIDTYKIPNRSIFPLTMKINNCLFLISFKLNEIHGINSSKASLRVYKNEQLFLNQLKLNTEYILKSL
ncbi:hypothetical protein BC952_0530 [Flavobacterium limicola]|jgi:hypothetical protein|uniref:Uncharacterized protein n=1 Tax=Flavobacterium limicola TaxID=180441 RepID=A0A495S6V5_9FLAO|nr:hypothetical protein [Flavobacterium limicola]RKS94896.1 hypothetical protein BC952_0530 [Flavobacterium limicola]